MDSPNAATESPENPRSILRSAGLSRAGFSHGFSTRLGGVSPPPHDSLDFATLRDPERLAENQARLARAIGFDVALLHQTKQVHGSTIVVADGNPKALLEREADAILAEPGTGYAVGVRVADCVPVLLADSATGRVAAVHAGWRGVESNIVKVAVERLAVGNPERHLIAAIGPCIGPCCFEVGMDVAERIATAVGTRDVIDREIQGGKAFIDLRRAVRAQLRALDVSDSRIEDVPSQSRDGCTYCMTARFYSYRRDADRSGRLIGVIVAK